MTTDEEFDHFVIDELKALVSDLKHGCTPSNICLMEVVVKELINQEREK